MVLVLLRGARVCVVHTWDGFVLSESRPAAVCQAVFLCVDLGASFGSIRHCNR